MELESCRELGSLNGTVLPFPPESLLTQISVSPAVPGWIPLSLLQVQRVGASPLCFIKEKCVCINSTAIRCAPHTTFDGRDVRTCYMASCKYSSICFSVLKEIRNSDHAFYLTWGRWQHT